MMCLDTMSSEEKFRFGGWLYYISEGWKDPDWWEKHKEFAEATGHVMKVTVVKIYTSLDERR